MLPFGYRCDNCMCVGLNAVHQASVAARGMIDEPSIASLAIHPVVQLRAVVVSNEE